MIGSWQQKWRSNNLEKISTVKKNHLTHKKNATFASFNDRFARHVNLLAETAKTQTTSTSGRLVLWNLNLFWRKFVAIRMELEHLIWQMIRWAHTISKGQKVAAIGSWLFGSTTYDSSFRLSGVWQRQHSTGVCRTAAAALQFVWGKEQESNGLLCLFCLTGGRSCNLKRCCNSLAYMLL